jgi:hypothetical protein
MTASLRSIDSQAKSSISLRNGCTLRTLGVPCSSVFFTLRDFIVKVSQKNGKPQTRFPRLSCAWQTRQAEDRRRPSRWRRSATLSLAYSPGVAYPGARHRRRRLSWPTTTPPRATWWPSSPTAPPFSAWATAARWQAKPVMEGKAVLFKRFADVDVFDIEVNSKDSDDIIKFGEMIAPTLGGINLEDIKAPECFYIEHRAAEARVTSPSSTTTSTAPPSSPAPVCSTRWRSSASASTRSRSCSTAPAPPRLRRPISTWRWAPSARTSSCATARASSTRDAPPA